MQPAPRLPRHGHAVDATNDSRAVIAFVRLLHRLGVRDEADIVAALTGRR